MLFFWRLVPVVAIPTVRGVPSLKEANMSLVRPDWFDDRGNFRWEWYRKKCDRCFLVMHDPCPNCFPEEHEQARKAAEEKRKEDDPYDWRSRSPGGIHNP
jgi:hypothetical protein